MGTLDLSINRERSRLVHLWNNIDGFDLLGFSNRKLPIRKKGGNILYITSRISKKKSESSGRENFTYGLLKRN